MTDSFHERSTHTPSAAARELETMGRTVTALTHIQTHLDGDLSLERLARKVNLSPFYFQRQFQAAIGESPKQYTNRLRLERAAYHLKIREASILDIAISSGFHSHETFSRAFKRHFGLSPRDYRRSERSHRPAQPNPERKTLNKGQTGYELSRAKVLQLNEIGVAFIRNLGPYVEVDISLYDKLVAWAQSHGYDHEDALLIGIGHDDPNITPPDKLRFDACLQVRTSFKPEGQIGYQTIPAGPYATASYVGPFGPTLERAYQELFVEMSKIKGYQLIGLPAIEIYRTTQINPDYALNHTDIFIPVVKK